MGLKLVVAAGATIETAMLPYRLFHLRVDYGVDVAAALSPRARDFVTDTALAAITGREVYLDNRQLEGGVPLHGVLCAAELLVLYPATARVVAECALGHVTCPVTRLYAFTPKERVVIAPAIHPAMQRPLYRRHLDDLAAAGATVLGGADLHADWHEIATTIVERLALKKIDRGPGVIRLDAL